jgi:hypothetical protein
MEPTNTGNDQESSIRWLLENRRPEVSRAQALRILRIAIAGDCQAVRLLDQMDGENDSKMFDK